MTYEEYLKLLESSATIEPDGYSVPTGPNVRAVFDGGEVYAAGNTPEDSFVKRDLKPGQKPPQTVMVGGRGYAPVSGLLGDAGVEARGYIDPDYVMREVEPSIGARLPFGLRGQVGYQMRDVRGDGWKTNMSAPSVRAEVPLGSGGVAFHKGMDGPSVSANYRAPLLGGDFGVEATGGPQEKRVFMRWGRRF